MRICMNWSAIRFDWNCARAFLVTAETGSFSAAARELDVAQPTIGRQVAALEEELDIILFERLGRGLALTAAGKMLLTHIRAMGDAAFRTSITAAGQVQSVGGKVSVSVTDMMAAVVMPELVTRLRMIAPQIEIEVISSNDISDLQRREADIAVRHVRPEQPELIARKLRDSEACLYASIDYLERVGRPETPEDVLNLDFVAMGTAEQLAPFLERMGIPAGVPKVSLQSDSGLVCWELAKRGQGVVPMISDLAEQSPEMENILPELKPIIVPYWLVTHSELHSAKRIRIVFDFLAEALSQPRFGI